MIATALIVLTLSQAGAPPLLTLDEALKLAEERNLDIKAAQAKLGQAQLLARKVWAAYLPQLSVGGSYTRNSVEAKIALPAGYWIRDVGAPMGPPFDPTQAPGLIIRRVPKRI